MIRVGLIGFGYWGPNLLRNLHTHPQVDMAALADIRPERLAAAAIAYPGIKTTTDADDIINDPDLDAVVIATPAATHYPLAAGAIRQGKHVLVEKPFCTRPEDAQELHALGQRQGVAVCVDHVYLLSPAVDRIRSLIHDGALGEVSYLDAMWVNLGLFQPDVSVLWDLGAHNFSIADWLLGVEPILIEATGHCHVKPGSPDVVFVTMHFPGNMIAHFNLSWMSPVKARRLALGGSKQMLIWDDLQVDEPLKVYDSGIELRTEEERTRYLPGYRVGDIFSPRVPRTETLGLVVKEFLAVIGGKQGSPIGSERAVRVVRLLTQAEAALDHTLAQLGQIRRVMMAQDHEDTLENTAP